MGREDQRADYISLEPIGYMRSDFSQKFGIPRQSGLIEAIQSTIMLQPEYATNAHVKGLEEFSHLWIIWGFSENGAVKNRATVRPPRLGGNERLGVWATRSPFRPNPLGLSCVRILDIRMEETGVVIDVAGADLMDQTPIYDIKPYIPLADCKEDATGGFTTSAQWERLEVEFPEELWQMIPKEKRNALWGILQEDPRPAYQEDANREYGLCFAGYNIKFRVNCKKLQVFHIEKLA